MKSGFGKARFGEKECVKRVIASLLVKPEVHVSDNECMLVGPIAYSVIQPRAERTRDMQPDVGLQSYSCYIQRTAVAYIDHVHVGPLGPIRIGSNNLHAEGCADCDRYKYWRTDVLRYSC